MGAMNLITSGQYLYDFSKEDFSGGTEVGALQDYKLYIIRGNQPCLHISWLFNES